MASDSATPPLEGIAGGEQLLRGACGRGETFAGVFGWRRLCRACACRRTTRSPLTSVGLLRCSRVLFHRRGWEVWRFWRVFRKCLMERRSTCSMTPFLHGGMAFRAAEIGFLRGESGFWRRICGSALEGAGFRRPICGSSVGKVCFGRRNWRPLRRMRVSGGRMVRAAWRRLVSGARMRGRCGGFNGCF